MGEDEKIALRNSILKDLQSHTVPSPETARRLKSLEDNLAPQITNIERKLDVFIQETRDYHDRQDERMDEVLEQVKKTNGRVNNLESWKDRIDGGSAVIKVAWGFVGVFIIAASFALFNMYIEFQKLPNIVSDEIKRQLNNTQFELIR